MKFAALSGAVFLAAAAFPLWGQVGDADSEDAPPPPGQTIINSDVLHSDQSTHVSVFTGKVVVVGQNFHMTCQEMTVYFTNDNKVQELIATGDVVITQPDRVTHCGRADYHDDTDTFVLTDQPRILQGQNEESGTRITINRQTQKMTVDGHSKTIIRNQTLGANPTNAPGATPPPTSKP
jgi:lipopolysaccharide transport protein LptA